MTNHPLIDYGKLNEEFGNLQTIYKIDQARGLYTDRSIMFERAGDLITEKQALEERLSRQYRLILRPSLDELENKFLEIQEAYK